MYELGLVVLALSALAVAAQGITGATRVWQRRRNSDEALQRLDAAGGPVGLPEASAIADVAPGSVSSVVLAGLSAPDEMAAEAAMRSAAEAELGAFRSGLRVLEWAGTVALFVPGLLAIRELNAGRMEGALAGWLFVAAAGLGIAIAATLGRFWLQSRLRALASDMEKGALVVYNTAR